jgi:hypothetical protein
MTREIRARQRMVAMPRPEAGLDLVVGGTQRGDVAEHELGASVRGADMVDLGGRDPAGDAVRVHPQHGRPQVQVDVSHGSSLSAACPSSA